MAVINNSKYIMLLRGNKGLLFTGNIPRGVFCERRSQKTRDIPRDLCDQHKLSLRSKRYSLGIAQGGSYFLHREACCCEQSEQ